MFKIAFVLLVLASPALSAGAFECRYGSGDVFSVIDWKTEWIEDGDGHQELTITMSNHLKKNVRRSHIIVFFRDASGNDLTQIRLPPNTSIKAGTNFTHFSKSNSKNKLVRIKHSDVQSLVCVESVVYQDGSTQQFDG